MAISDKHPLYVANEEDWSMMRDTYAGESAVKDAGRKYLPPTSGMELDGMTGEQPGALAYRAYKQRAIFHDFVSDAVEAMIGMMHHKDPVIELPSALEPMREKAGPKGESLRHILRRVNEQQLVTGRVGGLLDLPQQNAPRGGDMLPYIALYNTEDILNWDEGTRVDLGMPELNLVVLDESGHERLADFSWEWKNHYRVLVLGNLTENESVAVYRQGLFEDTYIEANMIEPNLRGQKLEHVPFVVINTKDLTTAPDNSPLLGLANLAMAIYRGEADYRQNLFMQGQDTLVVIGETDPDKTHRVGANASINVPIGGDAKYIGVDSQGLTEQREALQNDKQAASQKAGQVIDNRSAEKESGEALKVRVAAQTATLNQVALTGAAGLEQLLKSAAEWVGADPGEVRVTPNLDFADETFTPKNLGDLMMAKTMGAPISRETVHFIMRDHGLTQMEYEDELKKITAEAEDGLDLGGGGSTSADDLPDDDDDDDEGDED